MIKKFRVKTYDSWCRSLPVGTIVTVDTESLLNSEQLQAYWIKDATVECHNHRVKIENLEPLNIRYLGGE